MRHTELIHDNRIVRIVELALAEDSGLGDLTSDAIVGENERGIGEFLGKELGILAGLDVTELVFKMCDETTTFRSDCRDGAEIKPGSLFAVVEGPMRTLLRGERVALNFLQRMSGIATLTRKYVDAIKGTGAHITDTRKTAPGIRVLDKMAVRIGGGVNHRFGLDDMVLIKDNHIVAAGSISEAIRRCQKYLAERRLDIPIEVETTTLDQVKEALACGGIRRIMLDNYSLPQMREAVTVIGHAVEVEASGGITLETVRKVAETGVDVISVGALTHSVKALDISLELNAGSHTRHA